ncbi:hypothetical protein JCM10450v2_002570 [Rhodotorula kratochvilovae]
MPASSLRAGGLLAVLLLLGLAGRAAAFLELEDAETWFAFGDSWTANGFNATKGYDPTTQPLKTSSGGRTWFDHISLSPAFPKLRTSHFDLAVGGATTWPGAKAAGLPNVSFPDEVDRFEKWFIKSNSSAKPTWSSAKTLFSIFFGINDITYRWTQGDTIAAHLNETFKVYDAQVERLYKFGARNFLLFTVPPYERAPVVVLVNLYAGDVRAKLDTAIAAWNVELKAYAQKFAAKYPDADVEVFDTWAWLDELLDNCDKYGFKNDDGWCPWYSLGMYWPDVPENVDLQECGASLEKYIWYDGAHPTWSAHRLLAAGVRRHLSRNTRAALPLALQQRSLADDLAADFPLLPAEAGRDEVAQEYRGSVAAKSRRAQVAGAPKHFLHQRRRPVLNPVLG